MEMLYLVTNRARESKVQHASAVKKAIKPVTKQEQEARSCLGCLIRFTDRKRCSAFGPFHRRVDQCLQTFGEHRRLAQS